MTHRIDKILCKVLLKIFLAGEDCVYRVGITCAETKQESINQLPLARDAALI